MNPFDYVNDINHGKKNIMVDDIAEKEYAPFIINRALSFFSDTVLFANEMNMRPNLSKKLQYDFFLNSLRKRKRYSPWIRKEQLENLDLV